MRRFGPFFLSILGVLAFTQNIFCVRALALEVTNSGPVASTIVTPAESENAQKLSIKNMAEVIKSNSVLSAQLQRLNKVLPSFGSHIEENLFGINWNFVSKTASSSHQRFDEVLGSLPRFQKMSTQEQANYFLRNSLESEILRIQNVLTPDDKVWIESIIAAVDSTKKNEELSTLLAQNKVTSKSVASWTYQLVVSDPMTSSGTNLNSNASSSGGILIARRELRFLISFCNEKALGDVRMRQAEAGSRSSFKGAQVTLARLAMSKKCELIDNKFYTLPIRTLTEANDLLIIEGVKGQVGTKKVFFFTWAAWIGSIEALAKADIINLVNSPVRTRVAIDIIVGTAVATGITYYYERYKAKAQGPEYEYQLKWIASLTHNGLDEPILLINVPMPEYLKSLKQGIKDLIDHGIMDSIQLRKVNR